MIVTSSWECLFISLGHSFEIFSCEGLILSVDALHPAATTQKMKKINFLSFEIPFYGDSRPKAIKRRRKWMSFVYLTSTEKKKHLMICLVHLVPDDIKRKLTFLSRIKFYQKRLTLELFHSVSSPKKDMSRGLRMKQHSVNYNLPLSNVLHVAYVFCLSYYHLPLDIVVAPIQDYL